jgi:hypothetical protein
MTTASSEPRVTVAFAMFCQGYDPERPTDLRQMTTGIGGWTAETPPTVQLTLAIGLWNAGGPGRVSCRIGVRRPGEETKYLGEGETEVNDPGEMAILPLKFSLTFERPGVYWAVAEFAGVPLVEVPFSVSEAPAPTVGRPA